MKILVVGTYVCTITCYAFVPVDAFLTAWAPRARAPALKDAKEHVDQLLELLPQLETKQDKQKHAETINTILKNLEDCGRTQKIQPEQLFGSYELAYFDKSIDGDRGSQASQEEKAKTSNNNTRKRTFCSRVLGPLFGLRYSLQHVVPPNLIVNDMGFKVFGIPLGVVAAGNFTAPSLSTLRTIQEETGTELRADTALRIDFDKQKSLLWFGHAKPFPIIFKMGDKATSPAVTLCTTYVDDRIRLALAATGGRLVFTRGGKATHPFAKEWETIYYKKKPLPGKVLVGVALVAMLVKLPSPLRITVATLVSIPWIARKFRRPQRDAEAETAVELDKSLAKEDEIGSKQFSAGSDTNIEEDIMEGDETRDAWLKMVGDLLKEEEEVASSSEAEEDS
jgi:hypothetical protein